MMPGPFGMHSATHSSLDSLAKQVFDDHSDTAATTMAKMLLGRQKDPPGSFSEFVALVPGVLAHIGDNGGRMSTGVLNALSDGFDRARHQLEAEMLEKIPTLKEDPS